MGFTTPEQTQVSEGPDGNTVETKVPGQSFGDRLGKGLQSYASDRAPIMSQLLGLEPQPSGAPEGGFPQFTPGTIPKAGPMTQMLKMLAMGG